MLKRREAKMASFHVSRSIVEESGISLAVDYSGCYSE
jgi:hypothetical protein